MDFLSPIPSLHHLFESRARELPEHMALLACDAEGELTRRLTNREFYEEVVKNALWLKTLGLAPGDVVALAIPNSIEILILSWTAWAMGIVTVPLDMKKDTLDQHRYKVKVSGAKKVIAGEGAFTEEGKKGFEGVDIIHIPVGARHAWPLQECEMNWMPDLSHQALILFTSGTTAKPKGAQLSLKNLIANADGIREWFKVTAEDRFMVNLPLHHINSTSFCLATFLGGASIAVPPRYSHSKFWQQAAKTESTFTSIVPTICYDQLSRQKEFETVKDRLKLNRIQIGSAPVMVSDVKQFMKQFRIPLYQGYGQTETALRVTGVPLDLPDDQYREMIDSNGIGKAMKWAEVAIMDAQGRMLGPEQEGEVVTRGPTIMKGYLQDPAQKKDLNAEAFFGDYFHTGDLGYFKVIDGEKCFFLKGRLKEIIIKGGVNLSPVAIEDKLKQLCPEIAQVFVVGVPNARMGEEAGAVLCYEGDPTAADRLKIKLKILLTSPSEIIGDFEKPNYVVAAARADLPFTSTGKVQRSIIKKIPFAWESPAEFYKNEAYRFCRLSPEQGGLMKQAFEVYNRSWAPLLVDAKTFAAQVKNGCVVIAVDGEERVRGFVEILRTRRSEQGLGKMTYAELTGDFTLKTNDSNGDTFVCVAIGSASHQPAEIPAAASSTSPNVSEVQAYLEGGHDDVYNFHAKAKGGLNAGARLIKVIEKGRPEDLRAMGYNMLLKYPEGGEKAITIDAKRSVATQLIEGALKLAQDLGVKRVYAFSRPARLLDYICLLHPHWSAHLRKKNPETSEQRPTTR